MIVAEKTAITRENACDLQFTTTGIQEFHRKYVLVVADKAAKQRCYCLTVRLHSIFKAGT